MTFRVGMKVVCVDASPRLTDIFPYRAALGTNLVKGMTYTVRALDLDMRGAKCVYLEEVASPLPPFRDGRERSYIADRFRPVVERKTSIELFHQIRRDVENNVPAELVGERA